MPVLTSEAVLTVTSELAGDFQPLVETVHPIGYGTFGAVAHSEAVADGSAAKPAERASAKTKSTFLHRLIMVFRSLSTQYV